MEKQDIFDRLMALPPLRRLEPFYQKNKAMLLYLFFGGWTFIVSMVSYALLNQVLGLHALVANIGSWIAAVAFAYLTNRTWVFPAAAKGRAIIGEALRFTGGRLGTLAVEELILYVGIELLLWPSLWIKAAAQVIVILLNYIISKLFVFHG